MYEILKKLINAPSVSGRENAVRDVIAGMAKPFADEITTDTLGNLTVLRRGSGSGRRKLMFAAHMDEIGFVVTFADEKGRLRLDSVGGINYTAAVFSPVVSEKGVHGVLVPEDNTKPEDIKAGKCFIDIGAKTRTEALRRVCVGDFFVIEPSLTRLCGKRICGRPLDDRIGCAILLDVLKKTANPADDIYFVFTVQEEVGCRGAKTAAYAIAPDVAIAVDVTFSGDVPGCDRINQSLGDGAAIKIKDQLAISDSELVSELFDIAERKGIKHTAEVITHGGTDAYSMQIAGAGCRACALSVPTRYIHSGTEMLDLSDAEAVSALITAYIENNR